MRCLFIHLLHFTFLIFPHSHLVCWGTFLGGKSIHQNLAIEVGILTTQPCLHLMLDIIVWFESLGRKMFFHVGEAMKVWGCQIRAVGRLLKNFPTPLFHRSSCVHTHTVQYPLRKCVVHENCGAWAMKELPSNDQSLNFKWIKRHLTIWSYLVAIK